MKSRLLGVFLSAFLTDFERTKTMLLELQLLQSLFKMLIENPDIHEEGYGIKLFIISMCYLIKNH